jgi:hypothetical protein
VNATGKKTEVIVCEARSQSKPARGARVSRAERYLRRRAQR